MNEKVAGLSVPSCLTVHDLSLMGRCALSVAIPVLAALGVQAVPLPTALWGLLITICCRSMKKYLNL